MKSTINAAVDSEMNNLISDLQSLIRQASISARRQGLRECADLVSQVMTKAGIKSELLHICDKGENQDEDAAAPVVYGEVRSKANPDGKTILFYNHYDVQPVEPLEFWDSEPFSAKIESNYIYGRGSADDKGELMTRIKAVECFLKSTGDVPCNIKFLVEGEEEVGSPNIRKYLSKYRQRLAADGVIWEFGYVNEDDKPIISLGMKGLLYVELVASGPLRDVHSSWAVLIENPAWRLLQALSTLRSSEGKILVDDWYKEVKDFTPDELALLYNESFDELELMRQFGVDRFINNSKGIEARKALAGNPSCNISGIAGGYFGEGAKTVLPATASAKLDFRLVPDMDPQLQLERLTNHLRSCGFENDIKIRFIHGEPAFRTPIDEPFVKQVEDAAADSFGVKPVTSVSSAGTGPMYYFSKMLGAPCVSVGSTYIYSRIHSPNEFARIDLLNKATKCIVAIIERFGTNRDKI